MKPDIGKRLTAKSDLQREKEYVAARMEPETDPIRKFFAWDDETIADELPEESRGKWYAGQGDEEVHYGPEGWSSSSCTSPGS